VKLNVFYYLWVVILLFLRNNNYSMIHNQQSYNYMNRAMNSIESIDTSILAQIII